MHLKGVLLEDRQKDTILSAGEVSVNITDWFFLKKNIELKYVGLKDAYINLQRTDSVWRHQFLLDYFTTPGSKKSTSGGTINIAFKDVDLKNILVKQRDAWLGQDMIISLASLTSSPKAIDFNKKLIAISALNINKPYVALSAYKGNKPKDTIEALPPVIITDSLELDWNANKWFITADEVSIKNGRFKNDSDTSAADPEAFDGAHIDFAKVYADFREVKWYMDTITTRINLSTVERSGLDVKHLIADAKVTPKEMTFRNLDLRTNDSYLKNYFSMKFKRFGDMNDFINKVKLEGHFVNADVNSDDIAFFAPTMKSWKKRITLNGKITGPVAELVGQQLSIQAGNATYFNGDASLTGLPNINETFMFIKANQFNTTYYDALAFAPALKNITTPDLSALQYVNFHGDFSGFIKDFVTYGTIRTALGTVVADVNMKLPSGRAPVYNGLVKTDGFNIGALLKEDKLGYVSTTTRLNGAGFNTNSSNIAVESKVKYIDYNKYRFQNIDLNGQLNKRLFDGVFKIDDPNAKLTLNGLVDYSKKTPSFDFVSEIQKLNFKEIKLMQENLELTGNIKANFTGNSIDDFLGQANISQATLVRDGSPLSFDSLVLTSNYIGDQKHLNITSNEFVADLSGKFNIRELPNSVKGFLTHYYPAYIKAPDKLLPNQSFSFDIKTNNISAFSRLIDSSLHGFDHSHITGSINTTTNALNLEAQIPQFGYANYIFNDVTLTGIGNYDSLSLHGRTTNIQVGDSLNIPLALFNISAADDVSKVGIYTGGNSTVDQARLNAIVYTYSNGVKINFQPSSLIVNGKTWSIDNTGELEFRSGIPANGQLVLKESTQELRIRTVPSDVGGWNDVVVDMRNINLGDISPYFMPSNRLEGLANGVFILENPGSSMKISSDNFMGRGIVLDNDSLGDITAKVVFDLLTKELIVNGRTLGNTEKSLAYDIHLYLKDQESQAKNIISLNATRFDLKYLNRFLDFLFSDITGEITGKFDLKGPFNELSVLGKGTLTNAMLKVNFTQCYYKVLDKDIELTENEINLNGIELRDVVTGNPVYLRGNITHTSFKNMFFDITVGTRKPGTRGEEFNKPVQVLNTTYTDNKVFFGNVKATGSFALIGPSENAYMKIDAIASTNDSSSLTIASVQSKAGQMPDWLVERKYGVAMTDSVLTNDVSKITYDLDVTANPNVLMKFVLDNLTGDEIKGRGSGTLNIHSGTSEALTIRGRYDIQEGNYNYTFQSFFKKPFEIVKGRENYISWNGDPTNAYLNIEAQYEANKVSFAPLASITIDQSYSSVREDVFINAKLTGPLFKPKFDFGLELDPNSRYKNDFNITNAIHTIETNPNEITRQVTYLIVFNSFAPPENGSTNLGLDYAANEFLFSSLSGILFNEINNKLNSELNKLLNTDKVSVIFSGSIYNRNIVNQTTSNFGVNQSDFNVTIPISMFKDRFIISLGSTLNVPLQSNLQQNVQFLPDVTAEWLINPSGSIRLNFFYRENIDYITSSNTSAARNKRVGGGISYRKEFDRVRDIFTNVRKRTLEELKAPALINADSTKNIVPAKTITEEKGTLKSE